MMKQKIIIVAFFTGAVLYSLNVNASGKNNSSSLIFIENNGQVTDQYHKQRNDIDFKISSGSVDVFISSDGLHYQWYNEQAEKEENIVFPSLIAKQNLHSTLANIDVYRLDVTLVGADPNAKVVETERSDYYENHYLPQCPQGVTAHSYKKIVYQNVYPGIDWALYIQNSQLKYDFIVHPGGNPADIRIKYDGATNIDLNDGALIITTPSGNVTESKPFTYELTTHKSIKSKFNIIGNIISFDISDKYDGTLIIDPLLDWATYYGGSAFDGALKVASDYLGNAFFVGVTYSTGNIATTGAFKTTLSGSQDAMLVKFDIKGAREWATYYGGSGIDGFYGVAIDNSGNIFCSGNTSSTSGIATTGAHQTTYAGALNASEGDNILVKFDRWGNRVWGTYYGGSADESPSAYVTCDNFGNVYLAGQTYSSFNIATSGSFQSSINGSRDGYLAKFNTNGVRQWGTYIGGNNTDNIFTLTCDIQNNVLIGGYAASSNNIATSGTHKSFYTGGADAFIMKLSGNGNRIWGTYYGGGLSDIIQGIVCIDSDIYISGYTDSDTGIATIGKQPTGAPGYFRNGFIAKFDKNGLRVWGQFYGGDSTDYLFDIAANNNGRLFVAGLAWSDTGIATTNAPKTTKSGINDVFLVELDTSGTIKWGSYYGGTGYETGIGGIAWSSAGKVYTCGWAGGNNTGLATSNGFQTTNNGGADGFLASFIVDTMVYIEQPFTDTSLCPGDTLKVPYYVSLNFFNNNTFKVQLSDSSGSFTNPVTIGTRNTDSADTVVCVIPPNQIAGEHYRIRIVSTGPVRTSVNNGIDITINQPPVGLTASANDSLCTGDTLQLSGSSSLSGISYGWTGPNSFTSNSQNPSRNAVTTADSGDYILTGKINGCIDKDTVHVTIFPVTPAPVASVTSPVCTGEDAAFSAAITGSSTFQWTGPGSFSSTQQNPVLNNVKTQNAGTYYVTAEQNGCISDADSVVLTVNPAPGIAIVPTPGNQLCPGESVTFAAFGSNTGTNPTYQWLLNGITVAGANTSKYIPLSVNPGDIFRCVVTSLTQCSKPYTDTSNSITIVIKPLVKPDIIITADPGLQVSPWSLVKFTAVSQHAGKNPQYQWKRNGVDVVGATSATWSTYYLSDGDSIRVELISDDPCAQPKDAVSNTLVIHLNLGINDAGKAEDKLSVYPNPNNGNFTIAGSNLYSSSTLDIRLLNIYGQVVYKDAGYIVEGNLHKDISLNDVPPGIYILRVSDDSNNITSKRILIK